VLRIVSLLGVCSAPYLSLCKNIFSAELDGVAMELIECELRAPYGSRRGLRSRKSLE
jgi:hypothetical protein